MLTPEGLFGKYTFYVTSAYGVSMLGWFYLMISTMVQNKKNKKRMERIKTRENKEKLKRRLRRGVFMLSLALFHVLRYRLSWGRKFCEINWFFIILPMRFLRLIS